MRRVTSGDRSAIFKYGSPQSFGAECRVPVTGSAWVRTRARYSTGQNTWSGHERRSGGYFFGNSGDALISRIWRIWRWQCVEIPNRH